MIRHVRLVYDWNMSHKSDKSLLSQPLRVETEEESPPHPKEHNYYLEDKEAEFSASNDNDDTQSLGPLPPKWEKAYTESGEVYFIE